MNRGTAKIGRRRFLKFLACVPAFAALGSVGLAKAETQRYGKLVDTRRCIGCKRCMSACKRWNNLEVERDEMITDRETDLTANNWVVVNLLIDSKNRNRKTYEHWACQHCIQPACAGVCPVKAITKLSNGPVVINEKRCIGCRYCFQACPYKVPRFDFEKRVTRKCHLCYNRTPLLNYMKPACVAACPVGALRFDYKHEIIKEAKPAKGRVELHYGTYRGRWNGYADDPAHQAPGFEYGCSTPKNRQQKPGQDQNLRFRGYGGVGPGRIDAPLRRIDAGRNQR